MALKLDSLRRLRSSVASLSRRGRSGREEAEFAGASAIATGWMLGRLGNVPLRVLQAGGDGEWGDLIAGMGHSVVDCSSRSALPTRRIASAQAADLLEAPCRFDAITACSIGLGHLDPDAFQRQARLLAPHGRILLATILGRPAGNGDLLNGSVLLEEDYWLKDEAKHWIPCHKEQAMSALASGARLLGLFEYGAAHGAGAAVPVDALTFMTSCKPFQGVDEQNQNIALKSWADAGIGIVVAGDEAKGAGSSGGLTIVGSVRRAQALQSAAPFLRDIVAAGLQSGTAPWLGLINADIVVPKDIIARLDGLVRRHGSDAIFAVRRRNLHAHRPDLLDKMPLPCADWSFHSALGSDVFIASRPMWQKILAVMPDFVFGRITWDNWMHCCMIRLGKPVDASWPLEAYHLPHDYHIQSGESLDAVSHTDTPADRHNRALFQESTMRIGDLGDVSVDGHWFIGEAPGLRLST
jgi:SAM-dependent methyltransferase